MRNLFEQCDIGFGSKAHISHCTRHDRFTSGGATKSAFGCYGSVRQRVWLKPSFSASRIANRMPLRQKPYFSKLFA